MNIVYIKWEQEAFVKRSLVRTKSQNTWLVPVQTIIKQMFFEK